MTETVRFRCNNCGERFEKDILTKSEEREYDQEKRPYSPVRCPKCRRGDVRRGWE
ncbi:zinc ribbon domain-containing protein [Salmonella enterica subsp. enterica serovar Newport]|nr:zinc ribbon domain-containing protein [Salmonella enterica subsp. enterica]EBW1603869.1 zinc ribbon domain-containing protein [Salmonella enterica subsp. enterica serovar Kottbus]EBX4816856.1 zinc ribbon domain-containing protein [Salmonella enterica subsp. enterica serovar Newport]